MMDLHGKMELTAPSILGSDKSLVIILTCEQQQHLERAAQIVGWTVAELIQVGAMAQATSIIEEAEEWAADDARAD